MSLKLGDRNETVRKWRAVMNARFGPLYARLRGELPADTDQFGPRAKAWQEEYERRTGQPVDGIVSDADLAALGIKRAGARPLVFTVEGHLSNMFAGPVADTATQLEAEDICHHQPIGYNNGAIPFDNKSGVDQLDRLFGQSKMDNGVPFPLGTKYVLSGFSQGMIVVTDFIVNSLQPGQLHAPRMKDCLGLLAYGNPCRTAGSVAPWSVAQAGPRENFGLDPLIRLDKLGIQLPFPVMDVYREGDIFTDNEPTEAGELKAAVYQAVARGDILSNPYSICAQLAQLFTVTFAEVWAIFVAITSGVRFLATGNTNPHYSPFNITGGKDWVRSLLLAA